MRKKEQRKRKVRKREEGRREKMITGNLGKQEEGRNKDKGIR